jgi:DNA polymerase III delta subunit
MAKKTADESLQAFRHLTGSDPLERVYLFYGEDSFVVDKLVDAVSAKRFKGKAIDPLSWEVYRAGEVEISKPIDAVRTVSMFGGPKVVVYRDVDKLNETDLQKIVDYVKKPARAHLVLIAARALNRLSPLSF